MWSEKKQIPGYQVQSYLYKAQTKNTTQFLSDQITLPWERILRKKYCLMLYTFTPDCGLTEVPLPHRESKGREREAGASL